MAPEHVVSERRSPVFGPSRPTGRDGFAGRLTLMVDEKHQSYDRPPLSKEYIDGVELTERPRFSGVH